MPNGRLIVGALGLMACLAACGSDRSKGDESTGGGPNDEGSGGSTSDSAQGGARALGYCDVKPILAARCLRCHGEPPENGAPFSLSRYQALLKPAQGDEGGEPLYQRMQAAVEAGFMPATFIQLEPPVAPLEKAEKDALLEWFSAGAPLGEDCAAD